MRNNYAKTLAFAIGLTASALPAFPSTLTVNEGSATDNYVPFHFYYLDNAGCRTQVIFPADQLQSMKDQAITELKFHINEDGYQSAWATTDMRLSVAETDQAAFEANPADRYAEFMTPEWTVAYNGAMEGVAGGRELVFQLSAPYDYKGGNLLIQISLGAKGNAYPRTSFLGVTTENFPAAYTTNGGTVYAEAFLPMTTFTYGERAPFEAKLSAEALAFPTTLKGKTTVSSLSVVNMGINAFPVSVNIDGSDAFTVGTVPATLESGKSADIPVSFAPTASGDYTATVNLDLGEAGTFQIALTGKGMETPSGYSADFNMPSKSLPESWIGWAVTREYDYSANDYVNIVEAKETLSYFNAYTKAGTSGIDIEEGNHIRSYPNMTIVYMISPEVEGNFMLQMAKTSNFDGLTLYPATKGADGSWTIGTEAIPYTWAAEPADSWGIAIGSVAAGTHIAVDMQNMAIATFAADKLSDGASEDYKAVLSADNVAFGSVNAGEAASRTITVANKGTKPFGITLQPIADDAFEAACAAATLEAGLTAEITVTFTPEAAGTFASELKIDLGEAGIHTVALSGEAVASSADVPVGTEFTVGDINYIVTATGEVGVAGVAPGTKECTIPATVQNAGGASFSVVSVEREAFYWSGVTKVVLPEGLRSIAFGAFRQSDLAEINLPSTLTSIDDYAFRATKLTSVAVPEGITSLGSSVFGVCEQLSEITLPSTLQSLGSGVFYKTAIKSIDIPAGCTDIAMEAFEGCASITHVGLPATLTEIKEMTFMDCGMLTSVELPAALARIGTQAFCNTGITALHLPASLTSIASNSFTNSPVATITVDEANTAFKTVDGVLYSADGNFLYLYPRTDAETTGYTVADGTRGIIGGAFYKTSLKTVTLPQSLVGIDEMAFCNSALESISIPDGVSLILGQAFAGTQLKELVLPAALEKIEVGLLAECKKLTTVTLDEALTDVGNRAFYNCTALESIICKGSTPSEFDGWDGFTDPFRGVDKSKVTVYCPDDAVADYKSSEWGDFFDNIKGISEFSGIASIGADGISIVGGTTISVQSPVAVAVAVFDMTGRTVFAATGENIVVDNLAAGIYIVKAGPATAKIVVR